MYLRFRHKWAFYYEFQHKQIPKNLKNSFINNQKDQYVMIMITWWTSILHILNKGSICNKHKRCKTNEKGKIRAYHDGGEEGGIGEDKGRKRRGSEAKEGLSETRRPPKGDGSGERKWHQSYYPKKKIVGGVPYKKQYLAPLRWGQNTCMPKCVRAKVLARCPCAAQGTEAAKRGKQKGERKEGSGWLIKHD